MDEGEDANRCRSWKAHHETHYREDEEDRLEIQDWPIEIMSRS